jgi:hypothetical protein
MEMLVSLYLFASHDVVACGMNLPPLIYIISSPNFHTSVLESEMFEKKN